MTLHVPFDNSYATLPERFFTRMAPTPVAAPRLVAFNHDLARTLGIVSDGVGDATLAELFSGNTTPDGASPLAQVYGGHQFGHWNPQLGDGRALLLGEVKNGPERFDIQLKGSGPTPYSRRGDGRAWLGPVLREYIMSEAMAALGVPTTRALAAVATGEPVVREAGPLPGAVLTRVAASHVRVGTFQYFAARGDLEALDALTQHVITRHYPDASGPADLLELVTAAQARLVAKWMSIGFIHGVMNTDNMAVSGETIDYGPCAFMDGYHPARVFSSIDRGGRYAYGNQPQIAVWNLAQLATSLVPLMPDRDEAVEDFTSTINGFADVYEVEWSLLFNAKLGLPAGTAPDLATRFLTWMAEDELDFTNTFRALAEGKDIGPPEWRAAWQAADPDLEIARATNPVVIPRLHLIEHVITEAVAGDLSPFEDLLRVVTRPFEPVAPRFTAPPQPDEVVPRTFCGT